jgi:hypothetical protein
MIALRRPIRRHLTQVTHHHVSASAADFILDAVSVASTDWEKEFGLTPTPLPDDDSSTTYLTASPSSVVASPSAIGTSYRNLFNLFD